MQIFSFGTLLRQSTKVLNIVAILWSRYILNRNCIKMIKLILGNLLKYNLHNTSNFYHNYSNQSWTNIYNKARLPNWWKCCLKVEPERKKVALKFTVVLLLVATLFLLLAVVCLNYSRALFHCRESGRCTICADSWAFHLGGPSSWKLHAMYIAEQTYFDWRWEWLVVFS